MFKTLRVLAGDNQQYFGGKIKTDITQPQELFKIFLMFTRILYKISISHYEFNSIQTSYKDRQLGIGG